MPPLPPLPSVPDHDVVGFRPHTDDDLALIADASTDELIPVITSVPQVWSDEAGREYIARQATRPLDGLGWSLAITDKTTGTAVGNLYINMTLRSLGCAAIGYWIGPSQRGRGYARQALEAVRDWGLGALGVERLTLYIDPENTPSLLTAERAGFEREELLPSWEQVDDDLRPMYSWRWGSAEIGGASSAALAQLGLLEHRMWSYRDDPEWLDAHLHDDFLEFGQSGRPWDRDEIIAEPVSYIEVEVPFPDLNVVQLDGSTWLVTYRSVQPHRAAHRASVWINTDAGWRLRFHQGTSIAP